MNYLQKDFDLNKIAMDKTLAINQEVNRLQQQGVKCINAAIGMFFDEDHHLLNVPHVDDVIKKYLNEGSKRYGSVTGGIPFQNAVAHWVLLGQEEDFCLGNIATPGGTGALSLAIHNYVNRGQHVFLSSPHWVNYDKIIALAGGKTIEYPIDIKTQKINFDLLNKTINEYAEKEGRIFFLLNDPGHNPTGYCFSKKEYEQLVNILNEVGKKFPVTLLVDYAYADYALKKDNIFRYLKNDLNFLVLVAISFSKTLSIYGLRLGSLLALAKRHDLIDEFIEGTKIYARGTWSSCNANLIQAVTSLLTDERYERDIRLFLAKQKEILYKRSQLLISGLMKKGYQVYPYQSGFFVCVYCDDSEELFLKLKEKHIFCLALSKHCLRISVSCLSFDDIKILLDNI